MAKQDMEFYFLGISNERYTNVANFSIMSSNIMITVSSVNNELIIEYNTISGIKSNGFTLDKLKEIDDSFKSWLYCDSKSLEEMRLVGILEKRGEKIKEGVIL